MFFFHDNEILCDEDRSKMRFCCYELGFSDEYFYLSFNKEKSKVS